MPAALVDSRDRIVDAHHGWQPFEHVPVEEERVSERTMRHHRVGNEQLAPGGVFRLIGEDVIALAASALYAWPSSYQPLGCFGASVVTSRSSLTASTCRSERP